MAFPPVLVRQARASGTPGVFRLLGGSSLSQIGGSDDLSAATLEANDGTEANSLPRRNYVCEFLGDLYTIHGAKVYKYNADLNQWKLFYTPADALATGNYKGHTGLYVMKKSGVSVMAFVHSSAGTAGRSYAHWTADGVTWNSNFNAPVSGGNLSENQQGIVINGNLLVYVAYYGAGIYYLVYDIDAPSLTSLQIGANNADTALPYKNRILYIWTGTANPTVREQSGVTFLTAATFSGVNGQGTGKTAFVHGGYVYAIGSIQPQNNTVIQYHVGTFNVFGALLVRMKVGDAPYSAIPYNFLNKVVVCSGSITGSFTDMETVTGSVGSQTGRVIGVSGGQLLLDNTSNGTAGFTGGETLTGGTSGATIVLSGVPTTRNILPSSFWPGAGLGDASNSWYSVVDSESDPANPDVYLICNVNAQSSGAYFIVYKFLGWDTEMAYVGNTPASTGYGKVVSDANLSSGERIWTAGELNVEIVSTAAGIGGTAITFRASGDPTIVTVNAVGTFAVGDVVTQTDGAHVGASGTIIRVNTTAKTFELGSVTGGPFDNAATITDGGVKSATLTADSTGGAADKIVTFYQGTVGIPTAQITLSGPVTGGSAILGTNQVEQVTADSLTTYTVRWPFISDGVGIGQQRILMPYISR